MYENGDDEFAKHYKGRKSNYLWNDSSLQVQIQGVDCTVDFELQHLQFSMAKRQAFFPIFVYVEDCTRNNSIYLKETYRLYIDGTISIDEKNESIPQTLSNLFFDFLCHSNLENKIDDFMEKENTAIVGLPLADKDICHNRKGEIICLPQ